MFSFNFGKLQIIDINIFLKWDKYILAVNVNDYNKLMWANFEINLLSWFLLNKVNKSFHITNGL